MTTASMTSSAPAPSASDGGGGVDGGVAVEGEGGKAGGKKKVVMHHAPPSANHRSRLYGSGTASARAAGRRAAQTTREHGGVQAMAGENVPNPPACPRPTGVPRSPRRNGSKPPVHTLHTEVRASGMDIGCFQVRRVMQDVEQKVRMRERHAEMDRAKWQRTAARKAQEVNDSRRTDGRGQVGKRFQTIERIRKVNRDISLQSRNHAPESREEAGFRLLVLLLAEAGESGRALLGTAAGLSRDAAAHAETLDFASALCARCEGLSELVLDFTDQLTAAVMGIRPPAAEEHGGPRRTESTLEGDDVRQLTLHTDGMHYNVPSSTLGAHPFADAETLEYMLQQLVLTISSAASLAAQSPRTKVDSEDARAASASPLMMIDAVMMAQMTARSKGEGGAEREAGASGKLLWETLNAKLKTATVSNETVAQIAPLLLKYGLMDFAKQLKKYGFHRLPELRKASVDQLVLLGMTSKQAAELLQAATGGAVAHGDASDGRHSVTNRAHGIEISNEAWFHNAELEPEPDYVPVTMADLRPVSRRTSPRDRAPRRAQKAASGMQADQEHAIQALVGSQDFQGAATDDNADMQDNPFYTDTMTTEEFLMAEAQRRVAATAEYKQSIKRQELATLKEVREEQEAQSWLLSRPAKHRLRVRNDDQVVKGAKASVVAPLQKITPMHLQGVSEFGKSNHTNFSARSFGRNPAKAHTASTELSEGYHGANTATGMQFSQSSGSIASQILVDQKSSAQLVALDDEIKQLMSRISARPPRSSHVFVGDPRFLPTDTTQFHASAASHRGDEFIERWSSLQMHSPQSIEARKQAMRLAKTWRPKTKSSFRVERVHGT